MVGGERPGSGLGSVSGDHGLAARQASVIEQIRVVARSVQVALADSALRAGLSQGDFQALVRLVVADGLTGAALRRILRVSSSSVSELADRLERAGMIVRARRPSDRRVVVLTPTRRGRRVVDRALAPVLSTMAGVVRGFKEAELDVVSRFLDDVDRGLGGISSR